MIQYNVLQMVSWFIERQLGKFAGGLDWAKVKEDLLKRVADLVPGQTFDAPAQYLVGLLFDLVAAQFVDAKSYDASKLPEFVEKANKALPLLVTQKAMSVK